MDKKEIKDYLKRSYELGDKLTGEDKETYTWLIYGYNQCAKLLNKTEQQCKKQKEANNKIQMIITDMQLELIKIKPYHSYVVDGNVIRNMTKNIEDILQEVSE